MRKYPYTISIVIQDTCVRVQTNSKAYIDYLGKIFEASAGGDTHPPMDVYLDSQESLYRVIKPHDFGDLQRFLRIGRRIWVNEDELIWSENERVPGLKLHYRYEPKQELHAFHNLTSSSYFIKRVYDQVVNADRHRRHRHDIFEGMTYYLVYYPILFDLGKRNVFPLHASAVTYRGKGLLIPGLPGVWKSTLSLALLSHEGSRFLSDNIVLYDGQKVYSFLEPIKLDENSIGLLPDKGGKLEDLDMGSYYGRSSYRVRQTKRVHEMKPEVLIIPCRGQENELVEISSDKAVQLSLDFNTIAGEIRSYLEYSSVQNMFFRKEGVGEARTRELHDLIHDLKCYVLVMRSGSRLQDVMKLIDRAL